MAKIATPDVTAFRSALLRSLVRFISELVGWVDVAVALSRWAALSPTWGEN